MTASQEIFAKAAKQEIILSKTDHDNLRTQLNKAFYSTQYSHASIWDWKPDEVYHGIDTQMRVFYLCAEIINTPEFLREGESIYAQLMWDIFEEDYNRQIDLAKKHNMDFKVWKDFKKATLETLESLEMSIYTLQEVHKRRFF
jgi:UDP-glucose 6-dehydrogenase